MIWKKVKDFDYEVSDEGQVRSIDRWNKTSYGAMRYLKGRLIKFGKNNSGYCQVHLHKDTQHKVYLVHRLVWETFVGPIPEGMQVNHKNENKMDNRLCNLNLLSPTENMNWGTTLKRAVEHNKKQRKKIICYKDGIPFMGFKSITLAAEEFNTTIQNISYALRTGKKAVSFFWKYLS